MFSERPHPKNIASSGALLLANSESGLAVFTGYEMRPSDIRSAKVTIANTGARAGAFELVELEATNSFARGDLTLSVVDLGREAPSEIYRGDISEMPADGIGLGRFEPGETRAYRFTVVLAVDSPNGGQGRGAGALYEWRVDAPL